MAIRLKINGETWNLQLDPDTPLLDALRGELGLMGAKYGCGAEQCGACKVLLNGVDMPSCRLPLSQAAGAEITTVEGLADDGVFRVLLDAFVAESAAQCGYCVAGMIISAKTLLDRVSAPDDAAIRKALSANLCRCGMYDRVRRAIRRASGNPDLTPAFHVIEAEPLTSAPPFEVTSPSLLANPEIDAWLRFNPDETITIFSGKVELGQGIKQALAQIAADELDVALGRVEVVCGDTARVPDEGGTTGSRSLETSGVAMRAAAAHARQVLLSLAFEELRSLTPAGDLTARDGVVTDPITGRQVTYWQLLDGSRLGGEVGDAPTKSATARQLFGRPIPRSDIVAKASGVPSFAHDMQLPGMLHARVMRPRAQDARLPSLDIDAIRALPGVVHVARDGDFVAVVAEGAEQAAQAVAEAAKIAQWRDGDKLPEEDKIYADLLRRGAATHAIVDGVACDETEAGPRLDEAELTHSATYRKPFTMHGALGPSAALALWRDDGLTVWSHSQAPFVLRAALAQVLELGENAVRVIHAEGAGCYGHNGADDVALDAALAARDLPGKPILLQWTRADENAWEPHGSAMLVELGAKLTHERHIQRWQGDIWSYAHSTRPATGLQTSGLLASWQLEKPFPRQRPGPMLGTHSGAHRNADPIYDLPQKRILRHGVADSPVRVSALRSLGAFANVFAIESFMDELAAAAELDPLDFRLRHLKDERARAVLLAAAEKADWRGTKREPDTGWGMALAQYKNVQCYAAVFVKLRVDRASGAIELLRAIIAADAGSIVNPDGLSSQLEGGFVQAASWTLYERARFDARGITSLDWESYPILRFDNAPRIETVLLNRADYPMLGAGEATSGPTPAAIANAIHAAVGLRLRDIPFTPDKMRSAAK